MLRLRRAGRQKTGIPPARVLRMATYDCDKYLGFEQSLGSIEAGQLI